MGDCDRSGPVEGAIQVSKTKEGSSNSEDVNIPKKTTARWMKDFLRMEGIRDVKVFVSRRLHGQNNGQTLSVVETPYEKTECLVNTAKQWNTTRDDKKKKMPDELKAARLYMFGDPAKVQERIGAKKKDWRLLEDELSKQIGDLPLPLEEYARRRSEIAHQRRTTLRGRSRSLTPPPDKEDRRGYEIPRPMIPANNDFSYMDRAAEETLNDSEYVKGVGIVPINRKYPKPAEEPVGEESVSPENKYTRQDFKFPILQLLTSQLGIIDSPRYVLQWLGKVDQVISITGENSAEILKFTFSDIRQCYYNNQLKKIMLLVLEERILITLADSTENNFMKLQTCCYRLLEGRKGKKIESKDESFFKQTAATISPQKKARPPLPQFANRGGLGPASKRRPTLPQKSQTSLLGHLKCNIPSSATASPDSSPSKKPTSSLQESQNNIGKKRSQNSASDIDSDVGDDSHQVKRSKPVQHRTTLAGKNPEGLYYNRKYTSEADPPVQVSLKDLVVRVRSKENRATGKRDSYDIFDGPWCIKGFDTPNNIHALDSEEEASPHTSKHEWEKMLRTKVKLNFPGASVATKWVEIGQLIPLVDTQTIPHGSLFDSCLSVAQLPEFQKLRLRMKTNEQCQADAPDGSERVKATNNDDDGTTDEVPGQEILYLAEVKNEHFVAVIHIASQGIDENDSYEVEKLRAKRIRLHKRDSSDVKEFHLETDHTDPWIKRIQMKCPELVKNRIAVTEYLVHWAGWPNEDDTWSLGTNNIPEEFIKEFHALTDPFRGVPIDQDIENPEALIFSEDLVEKKQGKGKPRKSGSHRRSSGRKRSGGNTKAKVTQMVSSVTNNRKDVDDEEDSPVVDGEDEDLAKAIQASMEEIQTQHLLEKHQKELGVPKNKLQTSYDSDEDMGISMEELEIVDEEEINVDMIGPHMESCHAGGSDPTSSIPPVDSENTNVTKPAMPNDSDMALTHKIIAVQAQRELNVMSNFKAPVGDLNVDMQTTETDVSAVEKNIGTPVESKSVDNSTSGITGMDMD